MVSLLVVSHSRALADAMVELVSEMKSEPFKLAALGGIENGTAFGSDALEIKDCLAELDQGDGVLIFADMGSSIMNSQMAISMLDEDQAQRIKLVNAPIFESLLTAVVSNSSEVDVNQLLVVAESTLNQKKF